ncbi:MAG TPA: hypothetical protein VFW78_04570 [Bacteroidia bacterium]|nr:hypothetical protein [Bacteroidia bacterium]
MGPDIKLFASLGKFVTIFGLMESAIKHVIYLKTIIPTYDENIERDIPFVMLIEHLNSHLKPMINNFENDSLLLLIEKLTKANKLRNNLIHAFSKPVLISRDQETGRSVIGLKFVHNRMDKNQKMKSTDFNIDENQLHTYLMDIQYLYSALTQIQTNKLRRFPIFRDVTPLLYMPSDMTIPK